ncbi:Uncharacterised protein [Mycobacteroides abscessus subsp. abscessus]|nr:Uncharacterised protein [Mycobacteroides abscessus subsp. abscessus]
MDKWLYDHIWRIADQFYLFFDFLIVHFSCHIQHLVRLILQLGERFQHSFINRPCAPAAAKN